jgi:predicted aspartyl protease
MRMPHWIAAGLILAATPIAAEPQKLDVEIKPASAIDRTTTTQDIAINTDNADRMTVAVSVAGTGPYEFLVDTGSERTVISRELARRLKLTSGAGAILHSVMGRNDVSTVHIPHLKVSSNVISVSDAPALSASNIGADGMLGIDSLRSQRVLFDFKAKTHALAPAARASRRRYDRRPGALAQRAADLHSGQDRRAQGLGDRRHRLAGDDRQHGHAEVADQEGP